MDKKKIEEEVMDYCDYELWTVRRKGYNAYTAVARCQGVVSFIHNNLFNGDSNLGDWWQEKMLPQFKEFF